MRLTGWKTILLIVAAFILSSCSASFEDELKETSEAVELEFNSDAEMANHTNADIEYHLPFGFEIEEEAPNNILLKNGSKTYILFYNQHEDSGSKVVYESTIKQHADWDGHLTFETEGKFGYLLVKQMNDEMYQVVTGIGGVKVTTETKNIKSDAATMMKIVNSVQKSES